MHHLWSTDGAFYDISMRSLFKGRPEFCVWILRKKSCFFMKILNFRFSKYLSESNLGVSRAPPDLINVCETGEVASGRKMNSAVDFTSILVVLSFPGDCLSLIKTVSNLWYRFDTVPHIEFLAVFKG